ncbi:unnamed protein product [Prunus armeniaca]|uniref:Uncharacterized protein n=1 Tax=Prunus armeniaca TaxID=36596 RepID=A0A6J5UKG6_PRUAR|nr:unnamed protein product [Prunus armeniaca]
MAVDKDKLEEDASIARFYKIVLILTPANDMDGKKSVSQNDLLLLSNSNTYAVKPRLRLLNMKSLVTSSSERDRFFYTCKVPNKDFDSFFSDENMKSFAVKEESSSTEAVRNDDVDNYAPSDNLWDVDQAQEDDNDFGVGDMDMDMDNASCSDD